MGEKYMKESDIYRCFYDYWEKNKSIGECLDMVPKYSLEELIQKAAGGEERKSAIGENERE